MVVKRVIIILFLLPCFAYAQQQKVNTKDLPVRILFVFDVSQSMYGQINGVPKMDIAKQKFIEYFDSLQTIKNTQFALRMYGHQKQYPPQDCNDTRLEIPFEKNNIEKIKARVQEVRPTGTTPIAHSLNESANDFPTTPGLNIIILVTDGIEECGGDPARLLQSSEKKESYFVPLSLE